MAAAGPRVAEPSPPFLVAPIQETPAALRQSPGTVAVLVASMTIVGLSGVWPSVRQALEWSPRSFAVGEVWRIVTYVFPHALGWPHVTANMVLLALFGWQLERVVGTARFLVVYLGSGAVGMALLFPLDSHERHDMSAGASLAVFGVLAALTAWHVVVSGMRTPALRWALPTCLVVLGATGALAVLGHHGKTGDIAAGWESVWHHAFGMVAGALLGVAVSARGTASRVATAACFAALVGGVAGGVIRWT